MKGKVRLGVPVSLISGTKSGAHREGVGGARTHKTNPE